MMIELRTNCCGAVISSGPTMRSALVQAVEAGEDLTHADLSEVRWGSIPLYIIDHINRLDGVGGRMPYAEPEPAVVETIEFPEPVTVSTGETINVQYTYSLKDEL